jgi:hypothetical protein
MTERLPRGSWDVVASPGGVDADQVNVEPGEPALRHRGFAHVPAPACGRTCSSMNNCGKAPVLGVVPLGSTTGNREAVIWPEVGCYAVKLRRWGQMDWGSRAGWNSLRVAHPRHLVSRAGDTGFNFYDHAGFTIPCGATFLCPDRCYGFGQTIAVGPFGARGVPTVSSVTLRVVGGDFRCGPSAISRSLPSSLGWTVPRWTQRPPNSPQAW